jgi:hypothetical protein
VVCEDDDHDRFAWHALRALGFHPREIRLVPRPADCGAAEQWVRSQYAREVNVCRRKSSSQRVTLLILVDGNTRGIAYRQHQLQRSLEQSNREARTSDESIIHWIPTRNIETWVAFLQCEPTDESSDYSSLVRPAHFRAAAKLFVAWYQDEHARNKKPLDSMIAAWQETKRLPP